MIKNETDKLLAYAGTGEITAEMIDSLVTRREDMKLYELTNSILHGTVNNVLYDLSVLSESMEPEQIMYSLTDAYITWYRAKTAAESGVAAAEMQRDFDYRFPFVVTNAFKDSRKFGTKYLGKCIVTLRDAQLELNTMSGADRMTVIEKTLIKTMVRER
jgi:DNA polymerase-3 subunit delta